MFTPHSPRMRYFTPIEANTLLKQLMPEIDRAVERTHQYEAVMNSLRSGNIPESEQEASATELQNLQAEIEAIVEAIHAQGVEVKGLRQGLIDFPAIRNGQEVCLCWKLGEAVVSHWHPAATGFAGRMPLSPDEDHGLWEWCN